MALPREPIFLARATYRRRRLIDAVRFLPVVGALFFLFPILGSGTETRSTATGGAYVFVVWFVLILASGILTRLLSHAPGGTGSDPLEPGDPGGGEPR